MKIQTPYTNGIIELSNSNLGVIEDAINNYWHFVIKKLEDKNLGDIERNNYEYDKKVIEQTRKNLFDY